MENNELVKVAHEIKEQAYAPYSKFKVGAALLTEDNTLYTGVNIENASFGATNCAERTAIFKAVSDGHRKMKAIAVAWNGDNYATPCGICRQVLAEFGDGEMKVICSNKEGDLRVYKLEQLLPNAFIGKELETIVE